MWQQGVLSDKQEDLSKWSSGQVRVRKRKRNDDKIKIIVQIRAHCIGVQECLFIK